MSEADRGPRGALEAYGTARKQGTAPFCVACCLLFVSMGVRVCRCMQAMYVYVSYVSYVGVCADIHKYMYVY